jgi:Ran GTPase-activating protein (RanGAP) involved in mRNA processing and transport
LDLSRNPIGFAAAEYLAVVLKARPWHPLREIYLGYSLIGPRGCQALIDVYSNHDARLRKMDLSWICSPDEINCTSPVIHSVPLRRFDVDLSAKLTLLWIVRNKIVGYINGFIVPGVFESFPRELFEFIFSFLLHYDTRKQGLLVVR